MAAILPGTKEQIVRAAAELITNKGLAGTTTRAIAERAGCAEGSIYRYFADKHALLLECVQSRYPGWVELMSSLAERAGTSTVRKNLEEVAREGVAFYRGILPMVAGTMADRELMEEQRRHFVANKSGPMKSISSLAEYIRREQRLGRCSDQVPPEYAARLLMGACFSQAYLEAMLGPEAIIGTDERFAKMIVRGLLEGLDPREAVVV